MQNVRRAGVISAGTLALVFAGFGTTAGVALADVGSLDPSSTLTSATSTTTTTASTATASTTTVTKTVATASGDASPSSDGGSTPLPSPDQVEKTVISTVDTVTKTVTGLLAPVVGDPTTNNNPPSDNNNPPSNQSGPAGLPSRNTPTATQHYTRVSVPAVASSTPTFFNPYPGGMLHADYYDFGAGNAPTFANLATSSSHSPEIANPAKALLQDLRQHEKAALSGLLVIVATVVVGGVALSHAAVLRERLGWS